LYKTLENKLVRINYQTLKTTRVLHQTTARNNLPTTTNFRQNNWLLHRPMTNSRYAWNLFKHDANYYRFT